MGREIVRGHLGKGGGGGVENSSWSHMLLTVDDHSSFYVPIAGWQIRLSVVDLGRESTKACVV